MFHRQPYTLRVCCGRITVMAVIFARLTCRDPLAAMPGALADAKRKPWLPARFGQGMRDGAGHDPQPHVARGIGLLPPKLHLGPWNIERPDGGDPQHGALGIAEPENLPELGGFPLQWPPHHLPDQAANQVLAEGGGTLLKPIAHPAFWVGAVCEVMQHDERVVGTGIVVRQFRTAVAMSEYVVEIGEADIGLRAAGRAALPIANLDLMVLATLLLAFVGKRC